MDEEAEKAMGIKYSDWLRSKVQSWKNILNFTHEVWVKDFKRTSLIVLKDSNNDIADRYCMKLLTRINENRKSAREQKVRTRYLLRFLGRHDLCDRYFTVNSRQDPKNKRDIPIIASADYPLKLEDCILRLEEKYGEGVGTLLRLKIATQMRTGSGEKELYGLRKGDGYETYLVMPTKDEFIMTVWAKGSFKWNINWIPRPLLDRLWKLYNDTIDGEKLMTIHRETLLKEWKKVTKQVLGTELVLHDLRKTAITWLWCMGVPLEVAVDLNVGWKDLNTAKDHYLTNRKLLRRELREKYKANIPSWFKEGLEEFKDLK